MSKKIYFFFFFYLLFFIFLFIFLFKKDKINIEYTNTIIVWTTQWYTAPIWYYEKYISNEKGFINKYLGHDLSSYQFWVDFK